jgi:small subunit ribosomal protein S3
MWHKVNPIAFRIPYILNWKSSWYANKKNYKDFLSIDLKVRDILKVELTWIPLWDILVSKEQDIIKVDVFTSKTSLILWKTWENIDKIKRKIKNKTWFKSQINVKEIKKPDLNAKIVWYMISNQIEQRMPYKRAIKQAISKSMEKWAKWIKVKVWWRLNGAEIARKETFKDGNIPTQTIRANINYCSIRAETIYGTIGLKVWIYTGDIFKKNK